MTRPFRIAQILYFVACTLIGSAIMWTPTAAQDTPSEVKDAVVASIEEGEPQACAECHLDVVADWENSPHATAYQYSELQSLVSTGDGDICLTCHVTGYQAFSGEFAHGSVTCEACHGVTPADHPDEPISVVAGNDTCGTCHTTSYREWGASAHGAADLDCVSCHNPHEQRLRFETANELCTSCHAPEEVVGYAHETHTEQACVDCHWHHSDLDEAQHILTGALAPSGHDANVGTRACVECHEAEALTVSQSNGEAPVVLEPVSRLELLELEAELDAVRAQGANIAAVRLIQGGVMGLSLGAVFMFGFMRLRPGRSFEEEVA
ncbi:MAG: cytochrome c3 family protein [Chloroflexota bacterium]